MDFLNKVVIVTGSASGIGRESAKLFSEKGAKLALVDKATPIPIPGESENALALEGDLTDHAFASQIVKRTIDRFGRLDALVNCAAILDMTPSMEANDELFNQIFDINVRALVRLTRACAAELRKTKGCVVNLTSAGCIRAYPFMTFYQMSKGVRLLLIGGCKATGSNNTVVRYSCVYGLLPTPTCVKT